MADIQIKKQRYADKENLKKLMKYIKATFANNNEINEEFYTKEQIDIKLESISGGTGGGGTGSDLSNYYTKSEVDDLLSNISGGTGGVPATNAELDELTTEWSFE